MTPAQTFDLFYANVNGQHIEVSDDSNINQCFDLALLWAYCNGIPKAAIAHLYAKYIWTQATDLTRQYFDLIPNTPTAVPQKGDMVIFDGSNANVAGHVSIANGVGDTKSFQSFDQNWAYQQRPTVITHNYDNPKVLGWLRVKVQPVSPTPVTDQTKYDFGDGFGVLELQEAKSKLHDQANAISDEINKLNQIHQLSS